MSILFRKRFNVSKLFSVNLYKESCGFSLNLPFCRLGINSKKGSYISGSVSKTGLYGIKHFK